MQAFLTSTLAVTLAEIGDKTQLLALVLATRFRAPLPIVAGIFLATIFNHALAGAVGAQVGAWLGPVWLRWIIGVGFLGMAAWTLIPDEAGEAGEHTGRGPFVTTLIAFFLAEMGDKTQLATIGLAAAHPGQATQVIVGTTLGMMIANVPVVFVGDRLGANVDLTKARWFAAALFAIFGATVLIFGVG